MGAATPKLCTLTFLESLSLLRNPGSIDWVRSSQDLDGAFVKNCWFCAFHIRLRPFFSVRDGLEGERFRLDSPLYCKQLSRVQKDIRSSPRMYVGPSRILHKVLT